MSVTMTGATIPTIERAWEAFKVRVFDHAHKAMGQTAPPVVEMMVHDAFYGGALTLFGMAQKATDEQWKTLPGEVEAYYREAMRRAADTRPAV